MEHNKDDKVEEAGVIYGGRRIAFFKSFEEAAEADHEFYRNLTPMQRLEIHFELSCRVFSKAQTNSVRRFEFES